MKISIVIPTHNREEKLKKLLKFLDAQKTSADFEMVVVIDNLTDTLSSDFLKDFSHPIRTINIENSGPGIARNKGVEIAAGEVIAFIDDDCLPIGDWVEGINQFFEKHPDVDIFYGPIVSQLASMPPFIHSFQLTDEPKTTILIVKKDYFIQSGGFDPILSYWSEDREFFERARRDNAVIRYAENIKIEHPPVVKRFSLSRSFISIKEWILNDYVIQKHPHIFHKEKFRNICLQAMPKALIILIILFLPINFILRLVAIEVIFFLISFIKSMTIVKKSSRIALHIPFIDILQYALVGWLSNFMSIITFILSRFYKKSARITEITI